MESQNGPECLSRNKQVLKPEINPENGKTNESTKLILNQVDFRL